MSFIFPKYTKSITFAIKNKAMSNFALIGNPIAHSKSPQLFKAAYGEEHNYTLIQTPHIMEALTAFLEGDYKGINITAPFKEQIFSPTIIDFLNKNYNFIPDKISQSLASANILIKDGGNIRAYNSDYFGVKLTIEDIVKQGYKIENVAVIGLGGAGKAAALAIKDMGYKLYIINRSDKSQFAEQISCKYLALEQAKECIKDTQLTIYTLALYLSHIEEALKLFPQIVFEANYANPSFQNIYTLSHLTTPNTIENNGLYVSGLHWLLNQAIPAFKLFTGQIPQNIKMVTKVNP